MGDAASVVALADAVLLKTTEDDVESALVSVPDFGGRPLLDATNPIGPRPRLGCDAHPFGALASARLLEPLALVWIRLAMGQGRGFALGVLRR